MDAGACFNDRMHSFARRGPITALHSPHVKPSCGGLLLLVFALGLSGCGEQPQAPPRRSTPQVYAADGSPMLAVSVPEQRPNLVIILLDTLRADAAAPAEDGTSLPTMPFVCKVANAGVRFTQASAPSSWTVPSVTSMLTGLMPREHGCVDHAGSPRLSQAVATYAEVLVRTYGYEAAAFTDAPWFRGSSESLLQGFLAGSAGSGSQVQRTHPQVSGFWLHGASQLLEPWNVQRDKERPFVLLLHSFDAHDPYGEANRAHRRQGGEASWQALDARVAAFDVKPLSTPLLRMRTFLTDIVGRNALLEADAPGFMRDVSLAMWNEFRNGANQELATWLHQRYTEGATWVDTGVASLWKWLEQKQLLENTLVVIASDHGEAFAEHGTVTHGHHLYDELVHVPLVFTGPGPFSTPATIDASVALIDVFPTFFAWAGFRDIPGRHGRSLLPLIQGESNEGHPVRAELWLRAGMAAPGVDRHFLSVRSEHWKYIASLDRHKREITEELFDLRADPEEADNLLVRADLATFPLSEEFCAQLVIVREQLRSEHEALMELTALADGVNPATLPPWMPEPSPCEEPDAR